MDDNIYSFIRDEEGIEEIKTKFEQQIITVSKKDVIEACAKVSKDIIDSLKDNGAPCRNADFRVNDTDTIHGFAD